MTLLGNSVSGLFDADEGSRGAVLSDCERFRYALWRRWGEAPAVLFVMLNPSTADAEVDDPTIRKCIGFAKRWGAGGIHVCNLYAWRATKPKDLLMAASGGHNVVGSGNDAAIMEAAHNASRIVAAWGSYAGPWRDRAPNVLKMLGDSVEALKLTKNGSPWHPLMCPYAVEPVPFGGSDGSPA